MSDIHFTEDSPFDSPVKVKTDIHILTPFYYMIHSFPIQPIKLLIKSTLSWNYILMRCLGHETRTNLHRLLNSFYYWSLARPCHQGAVSDGELQWSTWQMHVRAILNNNKSSDKTRALKSAGDSLVYRNKANVLCSIFRSKWFQSFCLADRYINPSRHI